MVPFDWVQNPGSTRPRAGVAALSFRERTGPRRLTNTERRSSEYLTKRRSLSVRFATPAIPGRSEKLPSESGSRPARGPGRSAGCPGAGCGAVPAPAARRGPVGPGKAQVGRPVVEARPVVRGRTGGGGRAGRGPLIPRLHPLLPLFAI